MHELEAIVAHWDRTRARGGRAVLATIVRVAGSTYRRPGARMLFDERGEATGFISGGCLEQDLHERAARLFATGRAEVVVYDMTGPEDLVWGLGLGCNGIVHVLLEPLADPEPEWFRALRACVDGERTTLATLITPEAPACGAHRWAGGGSLGRADLDVEADRLLAERRERERPRVVALDADALLVETLVPRWPLVIFGAGPDARPLVRGARRLGARVTVLDHREAHADAERLPEADATVVAPLEELAAAAPLDARTSCVLMTHNYHHDRALLRPLLESPARYVGLIGPRSRTEQLLEELRDQEGFVPDDAQRARLHAPVGLDIGADDPEAIALSILAEVVAERAGREGGFLRRRQAPLHDPLP